MKQLSQALGAVVVLGLLMLIAAAPAFALEIEGGTGFTLFPVKGADMGPFVSFGVWDFSDKWGPLANESAFVDFGQFDGKATLGLSGSIRGHKDTKLRIGLILLQEGGNDRQAYLRYGVPFGSF